MNTSSNLFKELTELELSLIVRENFGKDIAFAYNLLTGGLFNTTYSVTILPDQKLVLRVGPINRHLLLPFEENLMEAEKYVYEICSQNNIPVSNVLVCDTSKSLINRDYMFVEYIPSEALSALPVHQQVKDELYCETGFYAAQIHKIEGEKFGRISQVIQGNGFDKWSNYLKSEICQWKTKVIQTELFSENQLFLIDTVFEKYSALLDEVNTPKLIHADLWEGNVLVSSKDGKYSVAAIIDADRAVFGDIDFEFASGWMINESFMKGYGKELYLQEKYVIRRKIYKLLYNLLDSYICLIQYNNMDNSNSNKNTALRLLDELIN